VDAPDVTEKLVMFDEAARQGTRLNQSDASKREDDLRRQRRAAAQSPDVETVAQKFQQTLEESKARPKGTHDV